MQHHGVLRWDCRVFINSHTGRESFIRHDIVCLKNVLLIHKILHLIADLCSNQSSSQSICEYILASCTGDDIWISLKIYNLEFFQAHNVPCVSRVKMLLIIHCITCQRKFTDLKTITNSINVQKQSGKSVHCISWTCGKLLLSWGEALQHNEEKLFLQQWKSVYYLPYITLHNCTFEYTEMVKLVIRYDKNFSQACDRSWITI